MYSQKVREKLQEEDIEIGDRIKTGTHEGQLMPKPSSGDQDILTVKLDSGYNIGVQPKDLKLVEKHELKQGKQDKLEVEDSEDKEDVLILHTGGTIASRVSYEEGGVKPDFTEENMIRMYPDVVSEVNLDSEVVAEMLSEDMEPKHWQEIAEKIHKVKDQYDGIIIGHGTDTMQYTGAALTFMLQNIDTGIVLVGSQRSSDRPSTDANMNLYSATKFLAETNYTGIAACMHENIEDKRCQIMPASKIRKMHTSRRDAFQTINTKPIAYIDYQEKEIENYEPTQNQEDYCFEKELEENVGYLKVRPGMTVKEVETVKKQNYNGLIIEGTGLGHMPVNSFDDKTQHHEKILETISEIAEDTMVVMASQTINGRIDMDVYDAGYKIQEAGVISAQDMHPELAYVKAMWVLANTESIEEARKTFQENLQNEINDRTLYK